MEPTDKRSVGCEDESADCRFLENDLREWIGGGGKRVIIVEGHAQIFGENKQAKKTKNCQSRVFIGTDSADRSF